MMQVDCPKKCSCLTTKKMRKLREILSSQNIRGGSKVENTKLQINRSKSFQVYLKGK